MNIINTLWKGDFSLGLIIAGAMFINLSVAGIAGVSIPLIMHKYKIDPAKLDRNNFEQDYQNLVKYLLELDS